MSTLLLFGTTMLLVILFAALMVGESLRRTTTRRSVASYWAFHRPWWRNALEPENLLASSAIGLAFMLALLA